VQPVTPFSPNDNWNPIVRTIVPLIDQQDIPVKGESQSGLGDIVQSFFCSQKAPVGGWILTAGPVGLQTTATDDVLGGEQWGAGPTALALQQTGSWSYGVLANLGFNQSIARRLGTAYNGNEQCRSLDSSGWTR